MTTPKANKIKSISKAPSIDLPKIRVKNKKAALNRKYPFINYLAFLGLYVGEIPENPKQTCNGWGIVNMGKDVFP